MPGPGSHSPGFRPGRGRAIAAAGALACLLGTGPAAAAETFLGIDVEPAKETWLALKSVNIRAKPETKSKKVGQVGKNERVEVVGKTLQWLAIRREGEDIGFVYEQLLVPLIDGVLAEPLTGRAAGGDGAVCQWTIQFEGKTQYDDGGLEIADYTVPCECKHGGRTFSFTAFMFMPEAPFALDHIPVYQIGIDIRAMESGFEEEFSTNVLYDRESGRVTFDGQTLDGFKAKAPARKRKARNVPAALAAAVDVALGTWNEKVWDSIAGGRE